MHVQVDGTVINISRMKLSDRTLVTVESTGNISRKFELPIIEYPLMVSRNTVEFAPIHMDPSELIVINNHITVDKNGIIRLNDGSFESASIKNDEKAKRLLKRTLIDHPIWVDQFRALTGKATDKHILSLAAVRQIFRKRSRIPRIQNVFQGELRVWRIVDREELIYQTIVKKVYQMVFENLTESRAKYAIRKLNISKQEAIFNLIQAKTASQKVEIPWSSQMIPLLEEASGLVPNDTLQSEKAGLVVAKGTVEKNGRRYSYAQSVNPWFEHCSTNRQVVAKYVTQICMLTNHKWKEMPKLLAARMAYMGFTPEDGCVISASAAEKFRCMQVDIDHIIVKNPKLEVSSCGNFDPYDYSGIMRTNAPFINRGVLGTYNDRKKELRSKYHGIITKLEVVPTEVDDEFMVAVETTSVMKLEKGDKLADLHGNKVTIAEIMEPGEMPRTIDGWPVDIIIPPYLGKRASASRLKEEEDSLPGRNILTLVDPVNDTCYPNINVGKVAYIRISQHARKKLNYSNKTKTNYIGITPRGYGLYTYADAMYHMEAVGAEGLIREILNQTFSTNSPELLNEHLKCMGFELVKGRITGTTKTPFFEAPDNDIVINKVVDPRKLPEDLTGTVVDPRLLHNHSWLRIPQGIELTFHALTSALRARSYDHEYVEHVLTEDYSWMSKYGIGFKHLMSDGKKQMFLRIPPGLRTWRTPTDLTTLSDIQQQLNQILVQFRGYESHAGSPAVFGFMRRINQMMNKLIDSVCSRIFTKSGLLRNTIHPRVKYAMNAVLGSNPRLELDMCEIPYEAVYSYLEDEDWKRAYNLQDIEDPSIGEINLAFEKMDARCLVKRNPVHQIRNILGLRVRVHNGQTININPAIVKMLDGDFDGDTGIALMPVTKEAQEDIKRFGIEKHLSHLITNKDLEGFTVKDTIRENDLSIQRWYFHNSGISEDKKDIRKRYGEKKATMFLKLYNADLTQKELFEMQVDSAVEFSYMKSATANAGNIGNLLRNLMFRPYGRLGIKIASHVYHVLAQAGLDCKNSMTDRKDLEKAFRAFRDFKMDHTTFASSLSGFFKPSIIEAVWKTLTKNGRWVGNITRVIAERMPVAHIVNSGKIQDLYLAALNTERNVSEGSFVEKLLTYIEPRQDFIIKKGVEEEEDTIVLSSEIEVTEEDLEE
jgi:hypothetical protein